jgi:hypothetical protein
MLLRIFLFGFFSLIYSVSAFPQEGSPGSVQGRVVDSTGKQGMASASVTVLSLTDPNLHSFAISDNQGAFSIRNLVQGSYRLLVTYQGFQPVDKRFSISANDTFIDFGKMVMVRHSDTLAAVVVVEPPIRVKNDTVEFSADKFAVKPNAVAEDLLKKLAWCAGG